MILLNKIAIKPCTKREKEIVKSFIDKQIRINKIPKLAYIFFHATAIKLN